MTQEIKHTSHHELLTAAKEAVTALKSLKEGKRDGGTMAACSLAWEELTAAIAKVEGK